MTALGGCLRGLGALLLVGCQRPEPSPLPPPPTQASDAWTVFVYGHGDHNLSTSLDRDIARMSEASLGQVRVVVMADHDDQLHEGGAARGTEWLRIVGDGADPELLQREPEQNLDDPATLQEAIARVFSRFPAPRRAVILWGHGGGWSGGFGGDSDDGKLPLKARRPMGLDAMALALQQGLQRAGLPGERPLDLLGLDACLMGGIETAYAMRSLARVVLASAEIDYGNGWDYQRFFTYLGAHPARSAAELAVEEVRLWDEHHREGADDRYLRAHAAIATEPLADLAAATRDLLDGAIALPDEQRVVFLRSAFFAAPAYGSLLAVQEGSGFIDLQQAADSLAADARIPSLSDGSKRVSAVLDRLLLARSTGEIRRGQGALHVGVPRGADPGLWLSSYRAKASAWSEASGWSQIVEANRSLASPLPPELSVSLSDSPGLPLHIRLLSPSADVVAAQSLLLRQGDEGRFTQIALLGAGPLAPGVPSEWTWDHQVTELASAGASQPASPEAWVFNPGNPQQGVPPSALLAIPGRLTSDADAERDAFLLFSLDSDEATSLVVDLDGQPSAVDLRHLSALLPGARFAPLLKSRLPSGDFESAPGLPFALLDDDPPRRVQVSAAAGSYRLLVVATDVWGNRTAHLEPLSIP